MLLGELICGPVLCDSYTRQMWQNDQLQLITTLITPVLCEQVEATRRRFVSYSCTIFVNSLQVMHLIMSCTESCWQVSQSQDYTSVCVALLFYPFDIAWLCAMRTAC